uniref:non-specific serine/threonine protein kinase n=1 Tax=Panagrolaimus superbus TaxID=310955 RepID=A0A914Y6D2_9BILA
MKKSSSKNNDQENQKQQQSSQPENTAADLLSVAVTQGGGKDGTQEDPGSNLSIRLSSGNQSRQRSRSIVGSSRIKEFSNRDNNNNNNINSQKNNQNNENETGGKISIKRVKSVEMPGGKGNIIKTKKAEKQVVEDPLKAMQKEFGQPRRKMYGRRGAPLLQPNSRLGTKYTVIQMFAGGGFGQVYRARDEDRQITVAVKVEPKNHDPGRIILEQSVLSQLKGTPNAPTLYASGTIGSNNYIIMEILGPNLSDIRKKNKSQCLSLGSALRATLQATTALRTLHGIGYIHRDVKPSNFCIGFSGAQKRIVYLVDFGLSRQFRDKNGRLRKKRRVAAFRGTLKYVSVNVHAKKEQT